MVLKTEENNRKPAYGIDRMFIDRWSPRAFSSEPLTPEQVQTLFEAARWAPSCFNEQPWFFAYATSQEDRQAFADVLVKKNQLWAGRAPLLIFILARRQFKQGGRENRHAAFDAGAAWMSLALQARKMGLYAHAMAGFNQEKAYELLKVSPEQYHIMAAVAVGYRGESDHLPEDLLKIETPNSRNPLSEITHAGYPLAVETE
jgi:nitroreductase